MMALVILSLSLSLCVCVCVCGCVCVVLCVCCVCVVFLSSFLLTQSPVLCVLSSTISHVACYCNLHSHSLSQSFN